MGATSITGTGIGEAGHGAKYKPELHCGGCGCGSNKEESEKKTKIRRGCYTHSKSGSFINHVSGGSSNIKVC